MRFLPARLAVLRMAEAHTWVREEGQNRGQAVRAILASVGLPEGHPYCAAFVTYCGRSILRSQWPLPREARCQALFEAALKMDMIHHQPEPGAIFLLWSPQLNRFRHTGFVIEPTDGNFQHETWTTIEGNTSPTGSPEGDGVYKRTRSFVEEDRFIAWYNELHYPITG